MHDNEYSPSRSAKRGATENWVGECNMDFFGSAPRVEGHTGKMTRPREKPRGLKIARDSLTEMVSVFSIESACFKQEKADADRRDRPHDARHAEGMAAGKDSAIERLSNFIALNRRPTKPKLLDLIRNQESYADQISAIAMQNDRNGCAHSACYYHGEACSLREAALDLRRAFSV
jgi:hypothetical protein